MNIKNALGITALTLGFVSVSVNAETKEGTYTAVKGFAETLAVTENDQIGHFRLVLVDKNSEIRKGKRKRVIIKGVIKGLLTDEFAISHTLVNKDRTGVLYTSGDYISNIYAGDPFCSDSVTPFEIQETLIIVAGTGEYSNVLPGSTIIVEGVINNCPGSADFGLNNVEITGGTVTFQ